MMELPANAYGNLFIKPSIMHYNTTLAHANRYRKTCLHRRETEFSNMIFARKAKDSHSLADKEIQKKMNIKHTSHVVAIQ